VEQQVQYRVQLMCYVKWRAAFHERERRHDILTRAAARMRQRCLFGAFTGWRQNAVTLADNREKIERQGLTLVHFSAQPEPFLTRNAPQTPRNNP